MKRIGLIVVLMLCALHVQAAQKLYFVHNDHLGTPKVITDEQRTVVWKGHARPYGRTEVETELITNHRRFPGQRFDIETGLHYNYFRDYDPSLGRYTQSDPIGTRGGLNTYGYASQNPLLWIDPLGLDPGDFFRNYRDAFSDANDYQFNYTGGVGQYKIRPKTQDGCDGYTYDWFNDHSPPPIEAPPYSPDPNPIPYVPPFVPTPPSPEPRPIAPKNRGNSELKKCLIDAFGVPYEYVLGVVGEEAGRRTAYRSWARAGTKFVPFLGTTSNVQTAYYAWRCF